MAPGMQSADSQPMDECICNVFFIIDIDECSSNPCQNGATCNNGVNGYTCNCMAGFTGDNCQTGQHLCYYVTENTQLSLLPM